MNHLTELSKIHPDLIAAYLSGGKGEGIPEELRLFLRQMTWAAEIYETERNITRAARKLRLRIMAVQKVQISERACMERVYSALNYFGSDNSVSVRIWETDFANKFEDLAKMAAATGDYRTQRECYKSALECRRRAAEMSETERSGQDILFLFTPETKPEDLGFRTKSLKDIAHKAAKGYYAKLIDGLPVDKNEKKRLLEDADIEEVQYEDIQD